VSLVNLLNKAPCLHTLENIEAGVKTCHPNAHTELFKSKSTFRMLNRIAIPQILLGTWSLLNTTPSALPTRSYPFSPSH